jgi:hypothetical protein
MKKNLDNNEKDSNFAPQKGRGYHVSLILKHDSVAQLVEQMTLNHWVVGSSPTGVTYKDHKKWKITENQAFSVIFILSETPEIGKI